MSQQAINQDKDTTLQSRVKFAIPDFDTFAETLHHRLYDTLYFCEGWTDKFGLATNLYDRCSKPSEEKRKEKANSWGALSEVILDRNIDNLETFNYFDRFRQGELPFEDVQVGNLKDYFKEISNDVKKYELLRYWDSSKIARCAYVDMPLFERMFQSDGTVAKLTNQYAKTSTITTLLNSFAHNISAHSLTALKWWFMQRAEFLDMPHRIRRIIEPIGGGINPSALNYLNAKVAADQNERIALSRDLAPLFKFLLEKSGYWSRIAPQFYLTGKVSNLSSILEFDFLNNPLKLETIANSEEVHKSYFTRVKSKLPIHISCSLKGQVTLTWVPAQKQDDPYLRKQRTLKITEEGCCTNGALWLYRYLKNKQEQFRSGIINFFYSLKDDLARLVAFAKANLYEILREEKKKAGDALAQFLNSILRFLYDDKAIQTFVFRYFYLDIKTTMEYVGYELSQSYRFSSLTKITFSNVYLYKNHKRISASISRS